MGAIGFGEVVLGDFRLVTSGQAASASILECSPPLSCSSPSFSTLRSHISSSAHYRTPGIKDTVIGFILDHLIWVYNGDGLNRLGIGTAACVASRHSESHLAAVHFKTHHPALCGKVLMAWVCPGAEFQVWNGGFQASDLGSSSLGLNPGMFTAPIMLQSIFLHPT